MKDTQSREQEAAGSRQVLLVLSMSPPLHPAVLGVLVLCLWYAAFMAFGTMHERAGVVLSVLSLISLYMAACMAANSLYIELDAFRLRVSYRPLWQPGGKVVPTASIEKIEAFAYTLAVDRGSLSEEDRWSNPPPATRRSAWDLLIVHGRDNKPKPLRLRLRALREQDVSAPVEKLNAVLLRLRG